MPRHLIAPEKLAMYRQLAGFIAARPNGAQLPDGGRGLCVLYDGPQQGIPAEDGGRWAVICEEHGTLVQSTSKRAAMASLREGSIGFYDCCRKTCSSRWMACSTCGNASNVRAEA